MRLVRILALAVAGLGLTAAAGWDHGPKYVQVSGVVKLNGKPYPNAVVSFQPKATPGNPNPGQGSAAITDATGRFVLKTYDGHDGAVAGKHQVRIQTNRQNPTGAFDPQI